MINQILALHLEVGKSFDSNTEFIEIPISLEKEIEIVQQLNKELDEAPNG